MKRLITHALLFLGALALTRSGAAQAAEDACLVDQELTVSGRSYLACGQELLIRDPSDASVVLERRLAPSAIVGLFERNGEVFVELHEVVLRPVSSLSLPAVAVSGEPVAAAVAAPSTLGRRTSGEVISVDKDSFLVTLGLRDGVEEGDRLAVTEPVEEEVAGQMIRTERVLLVGKVIEVAPEHARVRLDMGETVALGSSVHVTDAEPTGRLVNRPRSEGLSLGFTARPFLPINDDLAFAILGDAQLTYRFEAPVYVRAMLGAVGGLISDAGNQSVFDGWVDVGFDHRLFALGLGVGALRNEYTEYSGNTDRLYSSFRPTLVQTARFGSIDGINVSVSTRAMFRDGEVKFGAVTGSLSTPVHRRITLVFSGGGGSQALYGFADAGARFLVKGNGSHGSLFVTPAVGYATIRRFDGSQSSNNYYDDNVGGPSLAVALEWRR